MREGDSDPAIPALYLLFPAGKRPLSSEIHEIAAALGNYGVSHDPDERDRQKGKSATSSEGWLELLVDGLTFDLTSLAPCAAAELPRFTYQFDFVSDNDAEMFEAVKLTCGPHLASGARQQPVMRLQLRLALHLARNLPDAHGVGWSPSDSVMSTEYFGRIMESWLEGGPFPGLGLIAYRMAESGTLTSIGLATWTGQELQIEGRLAQDGVHAMRLAVRLVNQLVALGQLGGTETLQGPDGAPLHLVPTADGRLIRVLEG